MGAYLSVFLKESVNPDGEYSPKFDERSLQRKDKIAKNLNKLWRKFSDEEYESNLNGNFYEGNNGWTLNFLTLDDIIESAKYFQSKNRTDLGMYPGMTDKQLIKQYFKSFTLTDVGSAEIKISGSHYCWHSLEKVRQFINLPEVKVLIFVRDYEREDLDNYLEDKEKIVTSRYCSHCIELAKENDKITPVFNKEITDRFNSIYKDRQLKYDNDVPNDKYNKKIIKDNKIIDAHNYMTVVNFINSIGKYDKKFVSEMFNINIENIHNDSYEDFNIFYKECISLSNDQINSVEHKLREMLNKIYKYYDTNDKSIISKYCEENNLLEPLFLKKCVDLCVNKKLPLFGDFPLFKAYNNKNIAYSQNGPESDRYNLLFEASERIEDNFKFTPKVKKEIKLKESTL